MGVSYSFHISNKSNAITGTNKLGQASKHNLRGYESKDYDRSLISIMRGSDNILNDVKGVYDREFSEALCEYNKKVRADRRIDDYLEHVSNSRSDCAVEVIIQVGDKEFWKDKEMPDKKVMAYIFEDQIRSLEKLCPEFKVASAVAHYDEKSPHLHIIGVPVAEGYQKGMSKQCAKTKVFTQARLSMLQDQMRQRAEKGIEMNRAVFGEVELKEKGKGRNKDIPKESLDEYYKLQEDIKQSKELLFFAQNELEKAQGVLEDTLETKNRNLGEIQKQETILKHQQGLIQEKGQELAFFDEEVKKLKGELVEQEELKERKADILGKVKVPWEEYQGLYHLATVQEDVKQLQKSLTIEKAAVDQKLVELSEKDMRADEKLQEADKKLQEAEDRLQKAPHYKQKAIEYRNKAKELQKDNEKLQDTVESQLSEMAGIEFTNNQLEQRIDDLNDRIMEQEKELSLFRKVFGQLKDWVIDKLHKLFDLETVIREPEGKLSQINKLKDSQGYSHGPYAQSYGGKLQYFWTDEKGNKDNSNLEGCLRRAYYPLADEIFKENQGLTKLLDQDILAKSVKAHNKYQEQEQTHKRSGRTM